MAKDRSNSFEDAVHISNRHSVVADRDAVFYCHVCAVDELFACRHASAALYRHRVLTDIFDRSEAGKISEFDVFSGEFPYEIRKFHTSDVAAAYLVGA